MIIEFLGTVRVSDIAPVPRAEGVISEIAGGKGGSFPSGCGILQLGREGDSLELLVLRQSAAVDKGGVDVEEAGRLAAGLPRVDPWAGEN